MRLHVPATLLLSSPLLWHLISSDDSLNARAGNSRLRSTKRRLPAPLEDRAVDIPALAERQCESCPGEDISCCGDEQCYWTEFESWECGVVETVTRKITFFTQETKTVSVTVDRAARTVTATGSTSTRVVTATATPVVTAGAVPTVRKREKDPLQKRQEVFSTTTETVIVTSFLSPAVTSTVTVINSAPTTVRTNPVVTLTVTVIAGSSLSPTNAPDGATSSQSSLVSASAQTNELSTGTIVGIVVAVVVSFFTLAAIAFFLFRRRKREAEPKASSEHPSEKPPVAEGDARPQPTMRGGHGTPPPYDGSSGSIPALFSSLFSFTRRPTITPPHPIRSTEGLLDPSSSYPPLSSGSTTPGSSTPGSYLPPQAALGVPRHKRESTLESVPEFTTLGTGANSRDVSRPTSMTGDISSPISPLSPISPFRVDGSGARGGQDGERAFRIPRKPVPARS